MAEVPGLPPPSDPHRVPAPGRPIVMAAVIGGGLCLLVAIVGITFLGRHSSDSEIATTALASIGSTLAGGFGGWLARGSAGSHEAPRAPRRSTDPPEEGTHG